MKVDISYKYLEKSNLIKKAIDNHLKKLERRIRMFRRDDPIHISVHVEKNPNKEQYFCRSHIYLPAMKVLAVNEKAKDVSLAISKTFAALLKQLDKVKQRRQRRKKPSSKIERREVFRDLEE